MSMGDKGGIPVVVGIDSNLDNGMHFLMIDYDDNFDKDNLKHEIVRLQDKYRLGTAHVVETSDDHYSVFFFEDAMDYFDALRIIHDTDCCQSFKKARMVFDEMTIRLSPKHNKPRPKLALVIISPHQKGLGGQQKAIYEFVMGCLE